jgi:hypothetical protein
MYQSDVDLGDDFHTYGLEWNEKGIKTFLDGKVVLDYPFDEDNWTKGGFDKKYPNMYENPWKNSTNISAPYDKEFYLVLNVAAGGLNGYFQDETCDKPWKDKEDRPMNSFWDKKEQWLPSWNIGSDDAAMKISSIKVWQTVDGEEHEVDPKFMQ